MPFTPGLGMVYTPDPINWCHPLNQGRVLWLYGLPPRDGGNQLFDLCGLNNGLLQNSAGWQGRPDGPPCIAGPNSERTLKINDSPTWKPTAAITWLFRGAWYTNVSPGGFCRWWGYSNTGTEGWGMYQSGGGTISMFLGTTGSGAVAIDFGSQAAGLVNTWVMTWDGATMRGYHDGVQFASASASGTINNTSDSLGIGAFNGTAVNGQESRVMVSDFSVWNWAMSPAQVQEISSLSTRYYPGVLRRLNRSRVFAPAAAAGRLSRPFTLDGLGGGGQLAFNPAL